VGIAAPASAHHNTITGKVTCKSGGGWTLTWSVQNSEYRTETITASSRGVVPVGTQLSSRQARTFTEHFTAKPSSNVTLTLSSRWTNGVTATNSGTVKAYQFSDGCESTTVKHAKALCEHQIDSTEWHFVITQVRDEASAPKSITVTWEGGKTAVVPLEKFTGGVAHYSTTLNLGLNVTDATMSIYGSWGGQFNLSHGPACTTNVPVPAKPGQTDPCGPNNAAWIVPNDTDSLDWTLQSDGRLTVATKPGYKFEDGTTSKDFGKVVDSNEPCKVPIPAKPSYQDPCGPGNASWNVPADTESLDWTLEADGDLVVATKPGYVFNDGTTSKNFGKAPDSGVKCTVPVPPAPSQNDPCGPNNASWNVPADSADYAWALRSDGHLVVTVKGDNTFPDGSTSKDYGLPTDSNEPCKVPVPATPDKTDPCGPNNAAWVKPADTASVVWVIESDGDLVASTTPGYAFEDGTTSKNFGKAPDSNEPCPDTEVPIPATPSQNDPCGPNNASWNLPADTESVDWTLRPDGHLVAEAKPGYVFEDGSKLKDFGLPTDANVPCTTPPPPPPTDACPEMPGTQPPGTVCVTPPPTDACPEVPGMQTPGTDCTPPAKLKKVKAGFKKVDKCETAADRYWLKKVKGVTYKVVLKKDGSKVVKHFRGGWHKTHGATVVKVKATAKDGYKIKGKKKWTVKFTTKPCPKPPTNLPPTGADRVAA
jgi:hypothetical protein